MTLPSAASNYQAPPSMDLSREVWDSVMLSIATRLSTLEATEADYDAVVAQLQAQALQVITDTITIEINAQRANLDALEADFGAFEAAYNQLIAGGVSANQVVVAAISGLSASDVQAAIAEVFALAKANETALANIKPIKFEDLSINTNLVSGGAYRLVQSSRTHTLPGSPVSGDTIRIVDGEVLSEDNLVTIARNGQTIMGLAENLVLDTAGLDFLIWFDGTDWRLF